MGWIEDKYDSPRYKSLSVGILTMFRPFGVPLSDSIVAFCCMNKSKSNIQETCLALGGWFRCLQVVSGMLGRRTAGGM